MPGQKITGRSGPAVKPKAKSVEKPAKPQVKIIRDTREKLGQGWRFPGAIERKLDTGDYTVEGLETIFTIDRKGAISEFATNIFDERFHRELERMATFKMPIVLLEFEMEDILRYPETSDIPRNRWKFLRITPKVFLKKFWELQIKFPYVHFIFAGNYGKEVASSLIKRAVEQYGQA